MAVIADPNPALLAELTEHRDKLAGRIRGMADLVSLRAATLTDATRAKIQAGLDLRSERDALTANTIAAYDNLVQQLALLVANGYPNLPTIDVLPAVFSELQGQKSDIDIAIEDFQAEPTVAGATVTFPGPTPKPQV